jgi:hypothetical protein
MKGLLILTILVMGSASADTGERDWTIERPMLSGFLSGLSLGACGTCGLGGAGTAAGPHDPFGMTPLVKEQLVQLAARPYAIGQVLGASYAAIVVGGVFFRRLNRLKVTPENS